MDTTTKEKSEALQYFERQLRFCYGKGRTEMEKLLLGTDRTFDNPMAEAVWREVCNLSEYRIMVGDAGCTVRTREGGRMYFDSAGNLRVKVGNLS